MKLKTTILACTAMLVIGYAIFSTLTVVNGEPNAIILIQNMSPAFLKWRLCLYTAVACLYLYTRKQKNENSEDHTNRVKALDKAVICGAAVCVAVEVGLAV